MTPPDLVKFIEHLRLPLNNEKELQAAFAHELRRVDAGYAREVSLGDGDIIDFLIGDVGLEMKIKGQRMAIYRQCERYCGHDRLQALVLATNVAMGMPAAINGKPIFIASLGRAWL